MNYHFGEKGLEIKFSWRERLSLFFKGVYKLDAFGSYKHSAVLLKLVNDAITKYGDGKKHGEIIENEKQIK